MQGFKKLLLASTVVCLTAAGLANAQSLRPDGYATSTEWPTYGHDPGAARFSPLKQITPANARNLKPAWTYHLKPADWTPSAARGRPPGIPNEDDAPAARPGGAPGAPGAGGPPPGGGAGGPGGPGGRAPAFAGSEATPIVVGGIMYIASPYGRVVALDATTGKEVWVYKLPSGNPSTRGVEYFAGDATTPPLIVVGTSDAKLFTLDAKTGALNTRFGADGFVTLDKPPTSPPLMYQNLLIIGGRVGEGSGPGTPGDVSAFDIRTGRKAWTFHTIPQPGEPNYGTSWVEASAKGRSGVNQWGAMSADVHRGVVYLSLGAPSSDLYGGDRPGDNLYGTSVVAVDAKTGKYIWHFQLVHHDVWDYDLGQPAVLFDVKQGGRTIPALSIIGKSSLLYVLDRTTGKPIHGVVERPVPAGEVPGEKLSPTQPFPLKPGPLARNSFSAADLNTVTPEFEAACRKFVSDNNIVIDRGPFSHTTYNRSGVIFPSQIGGANWGGSSFNPNLGLVFVNVNELGQVIGAKDPASGPVNLDTLVGNVAGGRQGPYAGYGPSGRFGVRTPDNVLIPCSQPPWGSLAAVNVHTGEIAWKVPLGVTETLPADKQKTGRPNIAGSIATAGGLVFIGGTEDDRFRAFDARTGAEVWTVKLNASVSAVPATYQGKDGKQYVVVTATGGSNSGAPIRSDEVIAFALP